MMYSEICVSCNFETIAIPDGRTQFEPPKNLRTVQSWQVASIIQNINLCQRLSEVQDCAEFKNRPGLVCEYDTNIFGRRNPMAKLTDPVII